VETDAGTADSGTNCLFVSQGGVAISLLLCVRLP
jgi:hypothetical protein